MKFFQVFWLLFFWRIHFLFWEILVNLKFAKRIPLLFPSSIYFRSSPFLLLTLLPLLTFLHPFCPTVCHSLWSSLTVISPRSSSTNLDISFSHFKFISSVISPKQFRCSHLLYFLQRMSYLLGQLTQFCASFHVKPSLRILLVGR